MQTQDYVQNSHMTRTLKEHTKNRCNFDGPHPFVSSVPEFVQPVVEDLQKPCPFSFYRQQPLLVMH